MAKGTEVRAIADRPIRGPGNGCRCGDLSAGNLSVDEESIENATGRDISILRRRAERHGDATAT